MLRGERRWKAEEDKIPEYLTEVYIDPVKAFYANKPRITGGRTLNVIAAAVAPHFTP